MPKCKPNLGFIWFELSINREDSVDVNAHRKGDIKQADHISMVWSRAFEE